MTLEDRIYNYLVHSKKVGNVLLVNGSYIYYNDVLFAKLHCSL